MNILCSRLRNLEQWVCHGIKFRIYKTNWNFLKIRKCSKILTHRAALAVNTFHIKLFPRVPKNLAAKTKCSEIFPEAFVIVNLPDECLKNHTMIQEIWQHHRGFRGEKELRKVEVKCYCNQRFYLAFRGKGNEKKSGRQKLSQVYGSPCRV